MSVVEPCISELCISGLCISELCISGLSADELCIDELRAGTPAVWRARPAGGPGRSETELAADVLGRVAEPALGELARVHAVLLELVGVLVGVDGVRQVLRDRL